MVFISSIYSWPLLTGDVGGKLKLVEVPDEYFETHSFLSNQTGDFRVIYVPEFVYSYGKDSNLKPFWNPEMGALQEFLTYSSPKPTFLPIGQWGHYYAFTLSPFYYSLLRTGDIDNVANFLKWADVRFIVIHNDIPAIRERVENCINYLNESTTFKLVFHDNFIYIFENQLSGTKVNISSNPLLVDGGYRVVQKFYNTQNNLDFNATFNFIFLDQKIPPEIVEECKNILTDKPKDQLMKALLFGNAIYANEKYVIYPYDYVIEHDPHNKWSRASYLDPHQQIWHPYVNWRDYSWDFDYMKGLAFTNNSNNSIVIPINLEKTAEYTFLLRFFANEKGGEISISVENKTSIITTLNDYNGFFWYANHMNLDSGQNSIVIKNDDGFNAISAISLCQELSQSH